MQHSDDILIILAPGFKKEVRNHYNPSAESIKPNCESSKYFTFFIGLDVRNLSTHLFLFENAWLSLSLPELKHDEN